ncbi:FadR/GntR family transcriptional regulator [Alicyclobacillus shizuokensis]|uniref:FadR/GntR family transcriptional regulator n=1 Tax=Alicyclobacillus shizuokensis TaxID=392014 RepID=UPI000829C430|nr:FadR/GntR family transcriptional regulator [Alicyclobacillus shizuokensis]
MPLAKKAYEIVAEELKNQIEAGILKPGDKLATIDRLAQQWQVGRSTIREALGVLRAQGLIESVQGGGTFVTNNSVQYLKQRETGWMASAEELRELLQVRKILETGAIVLAAEQCSKEHLDELRLIVQQMRHAIGNEEVSPVLDVDLHRAIARATRNSLLVTMMEDISSTMMRTIRDTRRLWLYSEAESAMRLFEEHESMVEAIAAQDGKRAAEIMRKHLERVEAAFEQVCGDTTSIFPGSLRRSSNRSTSPPSLGNR